MSDSKYYTIATIAGLEKIERYYLQNKTIELSHIGFGGKAAFYLAPDSRWSVVPNEWARIALERQPKQGFVGGGATIDNMSPQYKGRFVCHAGIYDTDGDLILIASTPVTELPADESLLVSCPVDLLAILDNAEHVTIVTDTAIAHPTYNEMHDLLRALYVELSKYATTDKNGLMEIATPSEVRDGADSKRAVVPSTLKPIIDDVIQLINNTESALNKPATTNRLGLTELATQAEVDNKTGKDQVVTVETLDKPSLIASLQQFATDKANRVKEELFGGLPSATLDTFVEVGNALQETGDAVATLFRQISEKLSITEFNEFKKSVISELSTLTQSINSKVPTSTFNQYKDAVTAALNTKWEAVSATALRAGITKLNDSTTSTITTEAATPKAVNDVRQMIVDSNVGILSGQIWHGNAIPVPAGFTRSQCQYIVSLNDSGSGTWDVQENNMHLHYRTQCSVNRNTGVVTATRTVFFDGNVTSACVANYLVIAKK